MKIAIVDDSPAIRTLVRRMLLACDNPDLHIVAEGQTASEAMQIYVDQKPDVMFLDVEMPGGSGLDVLSRLNCPVVILSTQRKAGLNAKDLRHAIFVDKLHPAEMDLMRAIRSAMDKHAAYRDQQRRAQATLPVRR